MNAKELGDMPAFPLPVIKDDKGHPMVHPHPYNKGMTVKELFAAAALAGVRGRIGKICWTSQEVALTAYEDADALLTLLAKETE